MGITSCGRATVPASIGTFYPPKAPALVPRDNGSSARLKSHMPITSVGIPIRRYTGDRRSPKPFGRITQDTRVILASFFDPICGDDHPCISRYARLVMNDGAEPPTVAASGPLLSACTYQPAHRSSWLGAAMTKDGHVKTPPAF